MSKHTPGPWRVCPLDWRVVEHEESELVVADIRSPLSESGREDAFLIAAAPELLHELEHLVRLMEPYEDRLPFPGLATLNGARAALKKARGE